MSAFDVPDVCPGILINGDFMKTALLICVTECPIFFMFIELERLAGFKISPR
jgi:hypothetical protein